MLTRRIGAWSKQEIAPTTVGSPVGCGLARSEQHTLASRAHTGHHTDQQNTSDTPCSRESSRPPTRPAGGIPCIRVVQGEAYTTVSRAAVTGGPHLLRTMPCCNRAVAKVLARCPAIDPIPAFKHRWMPPPSTYGHHKSFHPCGQRTTFVRAAEGQDEVNDAGRV